MANDDDWVADVKRWCLGQRSPDTAVPADDDAIGYEAAHPALQARHWPDAPAGGAVLEMPSSGTIQAPAS